MYRKNLIKKIKAKKMKNKFLKLFVWMLLVCFTFTDMAPAYAGGQAADPSVKNDPANKALKEDDNGELIYDAVDNAKPTDGAFTLADCYAKALVQSETIAINEDMIKVTEAHFLQALSIMLPHVSYLSDDFQQDASCKTNGSSFQPKSSGRAFNMTETLFSGFKAFAAIQGSTYEKDQRIQEKIRAEQLLFVDVSNSFYLLLEKRDDLKALYRVKKALISRIEELEAREKLGRSRTSEVVNAKVQLYNTIALIENVKNQEVVARQLLEFLVGGPVGELDDVYSLPYNLQPEEFYVAKSEQRPDIKAAKYAWELSKKNIVVVESDFLPTVSLDSNAYTNRSGSYKGIDWDVMLAVKVPIFEGTEVIGKSKEARLQAHESELTYQRTKRHAPYDIRESYTSLNTAITVARELKNALDAARENFMLQKKDYELSLVSNLEVLTAIQLLRDAERNYIHALYEAKRLYWQLRVSVGDNVKESLNDII